MNNYWNTINNVFKKSHFLGNEKALKIKGFKKISSLSILANLLKP